MNVLFILPDSFYLKHIMMGVAHISAVLKKHGHKVDVLNFSRISFAEKEIRGKIAGFSPQLMGISVLSTHSVKQAKEIARAIKTSFDIPIIAGGIAVTTDPESFLNCKAIDMICIGEGEYPMLELADAISVGRDYSGIKNLWVKLNGKLIKNDIRPLIDDLDELPFPDRTIFPSIFNSDCPMLMVGRGCPYNCSYCVNKHLKKLFAGAGKYVRLRSPGNVVSEMLQIKNENSPDVFWIYDDVFPTDMKWVAEFSQLYRNFNINTPFMMNLRPDQYNEELIYTLKKTGLYFIHVGIESGDEKIRGNKLNRKITNLEIESVFKSLKKHKISTLAFNIIGIPDETKYSVFKTISLNLNIKPEIVQYSIFQPYPMTDLHKECVKKSYFRKDVQDIKDFFSESAISTPYLSRAQTKTLHRLAVFSQLHRNFFEKLPWEITKAILNSIYYFWRIFWIDYPGNLITQQKGSKYFDNEIASSTRVVPDEMVKESFSKGLKVSLEVAGDCMAPLLRSKDRVIVDKPNLKNLSTGDIIVYKSDTKLISHRILFKWKTNEHFIFLTKPDIRLSVDPYIEEKQIIGKVITIEKPDKTIKLDSFKGKCLSRLNFFYSPFWHMLRLFHSIETVEEPNFEKSLILAVQEYFQKGKDLLFIGDLPELLKIDFSVSNLKVGEIAPNPANHRPDYAIVTNYHTVAERKKRIALLKQIKEALKERGLLMLQTPQRISWFLMILFKLIYLPEQLFFPSSGKWKSMPERIKEQTAGFIIYLKKFFCSMLFRKRPRRLFSTRQMLGEIKDSGFKVIDYKNDEEIEKRVVKLSKRWTSKTLFWILQA